VGWHLLGSFGLNLRRSRGREIAALLARLDEALDGVA
jgi:hypothetical protein